MKIEVRTSGRTFTDGSRKQIVELPEGSSLTDLLLQLNPILPGCTSEDSPYTPLLMQNGKQITKQEILADGDLIRLLYMLKGG